MEAGADLEVRQTLMALPPALRLPVELHYIEGYKIEEIARMLRVPSGTGQIQAIPGTQSDARNMGRKGARSDVNDEKLQQAFGQTPGAR